MIAVRRSMANHEPKTVLLVDDEPHMRSANSMVVEARGHRAVTAENGRKAIDALVEGLRPALIVLDVVMPEMDGFQVLERVRGDLGLTDVPVIMLTAQSSEDDQMKGFTGGADFYLTKPFDYDKLANIIDYLIGDLPPDERARLLELL
jgi:DNA-binding response OmpR family regulator